jgi:serine/threonine-protein kinase
VKTCGTCHRLFPDDGGFCPIDGQRLAPVATVPLPSGAQDRRVGGVVCGGRYRIYRKVADGGMGRVYQALDLADDRGVALKILHPDVASDPVSVARFKREFSCSASLPHEHIVEVLAFERTEDDSYALVMEYLEGEELRMLLRRERVLSPARTIRMLAQVAEGLEAAHQRAVVHRDLKPDNVFLCGTHDGDVVKILDFGSVRDNSVTAKKLTVIGTTIGSPYYMAPEQAQGLDALDHRADVWSLAAIAYECLTGRVPFEGATGPAILLAILTKRPLPPSEVGRAHGVPVTLDDVMEQALAKDMTVRIPTVRALSERIGQAYGLDGSCSDWAHLPEADLARRIEEGLPRALSRHASMHRSAPPADLRSMDAAFAAASAERAPRTSAPSPFAEDDSFAMGVPQGPTPWIWAAVAAGVVAIGALVALLAIR